MKTIACDDRELLAILSTDSLDDDMEDRMQHVEQCMQCQRRLEELAAEPTHWQKAADALSTDFSLHDGESCEGSPARFRTIGWFDGANSWTESMAKRMLSPPSHPEMLGRLGRYEVERMIGAGGMGIVFKAFDSELNRPVAIKVLAPFLAGSGSARMRFAREARAAAAIVHEHVVPIHNVETERDAPFLVMQYIPGESLQSRIDRTGPLQACEILRISTQIASGLSAAHQQGLVHRDIKPCNILLEQGVDRALITDFGLARTADDAALTRSGIHPGTPQFMSPEQAAGLPVDARSDLFSLGSVLYTMCTGRPPFRAESSLGVLKRIAEDEPRRIREVNPSIPEWLCCLVGKLMAKQPDDRFQSAAEAAKVLEKCLAHVQHPEFHPLPREAVQLLPTNDPSPGQLGWFAPHRTRIIVRLLAIVGILGLFAAYYFQASPIGERLTALQGEWKLVAQERDGKETPPDNLFNERLIIQKTTFSHLQTAPNGTEIKGQSGRLVLVEEDADRAIDFKMWRGTAHGIYKLTGDDLVLCVTREGGPRPDSFKTNAGDARILNKYRRKPGSATNDPVTPDEEPAGPSDGEKQRKWTDEWVKRLSMQMPREIGRKVYEKWLSDLGFENVRSDKVTAEVLRHFHPNANQKSRPPKGAQFYVYGVLNAQEPGLYGAAIEVIILFDEHDKRLALHIGPIVKEPRDAVRR